MSHIQFDDRYEMEVNDWAERISRRRFLRRAAIIAGGSIVVLACGTDAATVALTQTPSPPAESVGNVSPDDARIEAGPVEFEADGATLFGYLSRPNSPGPHPAVLVVHENRGLLPHFSDVTRRLAVAGYAALAVDMLSREGGTASLAPDQISSSLRNIPRDRIVDDGNAGVRYLQSLPYVKKERVGAMGFCFGGSIVWRMAVSNPNLRAAVPFYGSSPPLEEVPNLQVPVLGIYAGEDNRINQGVPDLEEALKREGKTYKFVTFPGANHAFFNDTGRRYHPQAAKDAWKETLTWFEAHLMN